MVEKDVSPLDRMPRMNVFVLHWEWLQVYLARHWSFFSPCFAGFVNDKNALDVMQRNLFRHPHRWLHRSTYLPFNIILNDLLVRTINASHLSIERIHSVKQFTRVNNISILILSNVSPPIPIISPSRKTISILVHTILSNSPFPIRISIKPSLLLRHHRYSHILYNSPNSELEEECCCYYYCFCMRVCVPLFQSE